VIEDQEHQSVSITRANTVIVGAGAAGMNAAVKLLEFRRAAGAKDASDGLLVVTGGLTLGASRMSGSDKQTYYKMGTSPSVADTAEDFAATLTAFGCCHGDTALAEGIGSLRGFYHLVEAGVPFPHDTSGAFIGYKTDHDPAERATSAGPKTSRFMSECLQAIVERAGVKIIDKHPVLRFVTSGHGADKRIVAMICLDLSAGGQEASLSVFVAENWIFAGGGPGEIYQSTVYPRGQIGLHAPALQAGLTACNLTESQYGLASIKFRWNVSGTYMQAIPRIFSTGSDGTDEREFLTEYFDDMPSMATNIFLKGYQWPFDAQRITGHQSSLIDMAVHQETVVRRRRVWMDFLHNPVGADGWDKFDSDALGAEAKDYLARTGASQALPVERLAHMNTPAIELYAEHEIDLYSEPLEIAVCAQHMNGGFAVDQWWQSNIPRTFVIGEMAGTHGVKRPGGSALNAGQVGALRAAEYIARACGPNTPQGEEPGDPVTAAIAEATAEIDSMLQSSESAGQTPRDIMAEIRLRMTRFGAHLRSRAAAREALDAAVEQYKHLSTDGIKIAGGDELPRAVATRQQCLTQVAMLKAICAMFDRGAGSRGSHCILDDDGVEMHHRLIDPETDRPYRFKGENEALRNEIIEITFNAEADDLFETKVVPLRPVPVDDTAFEPAWAQFREGKIYDKGNSHGD
jgi:succinate dehydrogenase/fumarate reductase flavoprotein subunit